MAADDAPHPGLLSAEVVWDDDAFDFTALSMPVFQRKDGNERL
jgi:hypothetical protein